MGIRLLKKLAQGYSTNKQDLKSSCLTIKICSIIIQCGLLSLRVFKGLSAWSLHQIWFCLLSGLCDSLGRSPFTFVRSTLHPSLPNPILCILDTAFMDCIKQSCPLAFGCIRPEGDVKVEEKISQGIFFFSSFIDDLQCVSSYFSSTFPGLYLSYAWAPMESW